MIGKEDEIELRARLKLLSSASENRISGTASSSPHTFFHRQRPMLSRRQQILCRTLQQCSKQSSWCESGAKGQFRRYASTLNLEIANLRGRPRKPSRWRYTIFGTLAVVAFSAYYSTRRKDEELNQDTFVAYDLHDIKRVSPTLSIFSLRPLKPSELSIWDNIAVLQSIQIKHPALQIARSYTPLPPTTSAADKGSTSSELRFLIREEKDGEMSGYLHSLGKGSLVEVRGPFQEYPDPHSRTRNVQSQAAYDEVVVLAGGTGVATALQAVHTFLSKVAPGTRKNDTKVRLLWAVRSVSDCPREARSVLDKQRIWSSPTNQLQRGPSSTSKSGQHVEKDLCPGAVVEELEQWKETFRDQLEISYFVGEENHFINPSTLTSTLSASWTTINSSRDRPRKLILVSGPDGFVKYMAGSKRWEGGREAQGDLAGVLGELKVYEKGWEVWKA
jgi:NAD(P)H-flavin reductase